MFANQRIVITGGSSGLGLSLAQSLAGMGARLVLVARDVQKLHQAADQIRTLVDNAYVEVEALDVTAEAQVPAAFEKITRTLGGIDVLINSAGILREGYFEELPTSVFREVMEINYFGLLNATRAALPQLKANCGRLVNIASIAGLTGVFGYSPYCAAKYALVGLSDSLRYELRPQGVKVHLVCPPEFVSPMVEGIAATRTPENRAHAQTIPVLTIDDIVRGTLAGLQADRYMIVPGAMTRQAALGIRHFPGITRAVGDRAIAKHYVGPRKA